MNLHALIITALVDKGYPKPSRLGVCMGIGGMVRQSILTDDTSAFNHFVDMFNPDSDASPLSPHDMQAWLDGIFLYQHAVAQYRITHLHSHYAFKSIALLNASEKLEAEGGLVQLAEFKEIYALDSLILSFQAIRHAASQQKGYAPLTLDIICNQHVITVAFDPCTKDWIYSDANALPIQRIEDDEAFALEVMSSFILIENDRQKIREYVLKNRDSYTLEFKILSYSTLFTQKNSKHWLVSWIKARKLSTFSLMPTEEMEALFVSIHDTHIVKEALRTLGRAYPRAHRMFLRAIEHNNTPAIEAMHDANLLSERQLEEGLFYAMRCFAFESQKYLIKAVNYDSLPLSFLARSALYYSAYEVLEILLSSPTISVLDIRLLFYSSYYNDQSLSIKALFSRIQLPFKEKVRIVEVCVQMRKFKILGILLEEYAPYIDPHELLRMLYDAISARENDVLEVCLTHPDVTLPPQRMTTLMLRAIEATNINAAHLILSHREFNPNECFYSAPYGENLDLIVSNVVVIAMIKKQSLLVMALLKHPKINLEEIESSTTSLLALATQLALPEVSSLLEQLHKTNNKPYSPQLFTPAFPDKSVQPLLQTHLR